MVGLVALIAEIGLSPPYLPYYLGNDFFLEGYGGREGGTFEKR